MERCNAVNSAAYVAQVAKKSNDRLTAASAACDQFHSAHDPAVLAPYTLPAILEIVEEMLAPLTVESRFYALPNAAKLAMDAGETDKAVAYARELLQMAPDFSRNWNYGNAIYYGYFVLGRAALRQNNLDLAAKYLLDSATTPGSPQLNNFGPNTTLAKELIEKGRAGDVLKFFNECGAFWKSGKDRLDAWSAAVRRGAMPDFGPNLGY